MFHSKRSTSGGRLTRPSMLRREPTSLPVRLARAALRMEDVEEERGPRVERKEDPRSPPRASRRRADTLPLERLLAGLRPTAGLLARRCWTAQGARRVRHLVLPRRSVQISSPALAAPSGAVPRSSAPAAEKLPGSLDAFRQAADRVSTGRASGQNARGAAPMNIARDFRQTLRAGSQACETALQLTAGRLVQPEGCRRWQRSGRVTEEDMT